MAWLRRVINTLRAARLQRDIDREIAFHISERADQLRAEGLPDEEARRRARMQFGNPAVQRERMRDADVAEHPGFVSAQHPSRAARHAAHSGLYGRRRADARARHRRQQRRLLGHRRRPAPSAALPRRRSAGAAAANARRIRADPDCTRPPAGLESFEYDLRRGSPATSPPMSSTPGARCRNGCSTRG